MAWEGTCLASLPCGILDSFCHERLTSSVVLKIFPKARTVIYLVSELIDSFCLFYSFNIILFLCVRVCYMLVREDAPPRPGHTSDGSKSKRNVCYRGR